MELKGTPCGEISKASLEAGNNSFGAASFGTGNKRGNVFETASRPLIAIAISALLAMTSGAGAAASGRTVESSVETDFGTIVYRSNVDGDEQDRRDLTHGADRNAAPNFDIYYDMEYREIHIYAMQDQLTQGTAILVESNSFTQKSPVVRINLITDDPGTGGKMAISLDVPLYSDVYGVQNGFGSATMVTEIWYHGGSARDEFSNYTAIPLHASGSDGDDFFLGGDGPDELHGGIGNDTIRGGAGDDEIFGYTGNDVLSGEGGNDTIHGYSGDDTLRGDDGNDKLFPGGGSDSSYGGDGDDFVEEHSPQGPDSNLVCGNDGADILIGAGGGGTVNQIDGENGGGNSDGDIDILYGNDDDTFEFDTDTTLIYIGTPPDQVFPGEYDFPYSDFISCGN